MNCWPWLRFLHKYFGVETRHSELRSRVNRVVGLGSHCLSHSSPDPNKPYGFCGRKAPRKKEEDTTFFAFFIIFVTNARVPSDWLWAGRDFRQQFTLQFNTDSQAVELRTCTRLAGRCSVRWPWCRWTDRRGWRPGCRRWGWTCYSQTPPLSPPAHLQNTTAWLQYWY